MPPWPGTFRVSSRSLGQLSPLSPGHNHGGMAERLPSVLVIVVAVSSLVAATSSGAPGPTVGPIPASVPLLRDAFALGTLVRIDPRSASAEFKISCGWYYAP